MNQAAIESAVRQLLRAVGEDPDREDLVRTPARVARMYGEILSGIGRDPADEIDVLFSSGYQDLVLLRDIPLYSVCEHHLTPFVGRAHVGYVPNEQGQITGLSKLARIVEVAARRPQVQEQLTVQVADSLSRRHEPRGVIVVMEAEHLCMTMRGVSKPGAVTATSVLRGVLRDDPAMLEQALNLIGRSRVGGGGMGRVQRADGVIPVDGGADGVRLAGSADGTGSAGNSGGAGAAGRSDVAGSAVGSADGDAGAAGQADGFAAGLDR
jgi:GTP cyclohydrolase I